MNLFKSIWGNQGKTDYKKLMQKGAVVIDVRSPAEYQSGNIPGSLNISLEQIEATITSLKQKNKPLIMVCRSGNRSGVATGILKTSGLEVYNGGAWDDLIQKIA